MPHYVAAVPNPKAALALLRRLEALTGIAVEASELEEETSDYEEQIGRAIAANPDIAAKIRDGKTAAAGALVGAVMKATGGQADAASVRELILERLGQG